MFRNRIFALLAVMALLLAVAVPMSADTPAPGSRSGGPGPYVAPQADPDNITEGFEDITVLPDWFMINHSEPLGITDWFQGNDTVFPAQGGTPTSYIGANFNNTTGTGTISNWLLLPTQRLHDGDVLTFYTRGPEGSQYPDRLEVRMSLAGTSTNVGTTSTDVGDFSSLLLSINPNLQVGGYPEVWTQFTVTLSSIGAPMTGRLAFRYFVTDGGPSGANSDYIGIDTLVFTQVAPAAVNLVTIDAQPASVPAPLALTVALLPISVMALVAIVYARRRSAAKA